MYIAVNESTYSSYDKCFDVFGTPHKKFTFRNYDTVIFTYLRYAQSTFIILVELSKRTYLQ